MEQLQQVTSGGDAHIIAIHKLFGAPLCICHGKLNLGDKRRVSIEHTEVLPPYGSCHIFVRCPIYGNLRLQKMESVSSTGDEHTTHIIPNLQIEQTNISLKKKKHATCTTR